MGENRDNGIPAFRRYPVVRQVGVDGLDPDLVLHCEAVRFLKTDNRQINGCDMMPHSRKEDGVPPLSFRQAERFTNRQAVNHATQEVIRFPAIGKFFLSVALVPHCWSRSVSRQMSLSAF
jgi:hypothetical protein